MPGSTIHSCENKEYEQVKRDNQLADSLQHLHKMHQLFIEDTMAALVPEKPNLNPMDYSNA